VVVASKSSGELEFLRPIDPQALVIPWVVEPQVDLGPRRKGRERQEVAATHLGAVGGESVDLVLGVKPPQEPVGIPATAITPDLDDIAAPHRPFALNANELRAQVEDQVIGLVAGGLRDADA
jgi:hypothetical protein